MAWKYFRDAVIGVTDPLSYENSPELHYHHGSIMKGWHCIYAPAANESANVHP